jgi:hypothetical protein
VTPRPERSEGSADGQPCQRSPRSARVAASPK